MLDRFGFTPTESRAYEALLRLGPSTGYAVALSLGIARANTYQALEALARRGAVRKTAGRAATYVALPPVALVAELDRSFRRDLTALEAELRSLARTGDRGRTADLEILVDRTDAIDRAIAMTAEAHTSVTAMVPAWAQSLLEPLDRAARRGLVTRVTTSGLADTAPASPDGPSGVRTRRWSGEPLLLVTDGSQALVAVVGDGADSGFAATLQVAVALVEVLLDRELASLDRTASSP